MKHTHVITALFLGVMLPSLSYSVTDEEKADIRRQERIQDERSEDQRKYDQQQEEKKQEELKRQRFREQEKDMAARRGR